MSTVKEFIENQEATDSVITMLAPIEFPCIVNGKELSAKITHVEDTLVTLTYHILFSDGYEADFTSIDSLEDPMNFDEDGKQNSEYAKGVNKDLISTRGFRTDKEIYCLPKNESGEGVNAWILQDAENADKYLVHTGEYRFTIIKRGKNWDVLQELPEYSLTEADDRLADKVCLFIDGHRAQ